MASKIPVTLNGKRVGWAEMDVDGETATIYFDYDLGFYSTESCLTGINIYIEEK